MKCTKTSIKCILVTIRSHFTTKKSTFTTYFNNKIRFNLLLMTCWNNPNLPLKILN